MGCQPVLVEGPSDQHYLTAIKSLLISDGRISPSRELVFPPCGGAKTARVVAGILSGRDETLPIVLLDDDGPGRKMKKDLISQLYMQSEERVLSVADYADIESAEVEDLFPPRFLAEELDRIERRPETPLADEIQGDSSFVGQVERWAKSQSISLDRHWKVKLATRVKQRALDRGLGKFDSGVVERWVRLFEAFNC